MDLRQQISALKTRMLELENKMAESDPHLWGCLKQLLKEFRNTYPTDYATYIAANTEYNELEKQLATLQAQLDEMSGEGEEIGEESV